MQNWGPHGPRPKQKTIFFLRNNKNQILSFQNLFILTKYHMFWLSYECFSILCKEIKTIKATGIDNLSIGSFSKRRFKTLSIKLSTVPDECKFAKLKPPYKKAEKTDPKNYRPISA